MAYFSSPPLVTIASTPWILPGDETPVDFGPWHYGGARWAAGSRQASGLTPSIIKSTDGGVTWAAQDVANSPANLNEANTQTDYWPDLLNGIIHMVGYRAGASANNLSYCTFNLNTGLYRTTINGAIRSGAAHVRLRADGTPIVIFTPITGAGDGTSVNLALQYSLISGGAFQAAVDLAPAIAGHVESAATTILDSNNTLHVFFLNFRQSSGALSDIRHVSLTSADVISTPDVVFTNPGPLRHYYLGLGQEFGGNLYIAACDNSSSAVTRLFRGVPSATPTWTEIDLNTNHSGQGNGTKLVHILPLNGGLSAWWFDMKSDQSLLQGLYSTSADGLTWSAPVLAWDVLNNTMAGGPSPAEPVHMFSVTVNSGAVEMVAGCYIDNSFNLSLVFLAAAMVANCASPPQGQVGLAYTHTFTVTGGTSPYTYTIGGFIPPGLSLASATGIISGIPTMAGTFNFTITVTDANGQVATVNCSIVIIQFSLSCGNPPAGVVGTTYTHLLSVTGGTTPFAFTLTAGALPDGLSLIGSLGAITGTPTVAGTFTFTVRVVDIHGLISSVSCSITITTVCDGLQNPQISGTQVGIDAETELYLRRFINDMSGAMTPSDQN